MDEKRKVNLSVIYEERYDFEKMMTKEEYKKLIEQAKEPSPDIATDIVYVFGKDISNEHPSAIINSEIDELVSDWDNEFDEEDLFDD